jgi:hypothetical protein
VATIPTEFPDICAPFFDYSLTCTQFDVRRRRGSGDGLSREQVDFFFSGESWLTFIISVGAQLITLSMSDEPKRE